MHYIGIEIFSYSSSTKIQVVTAILASISLGILLVLTISLEIAKKDCVLQWLLPLRFSLLIFSILCIIILLNFVKTNLDEDIRELRFRWSMVHIPLSDGML